MATITATSLAKAPGGAMPTDYGQRLALAVAEFCHGRKPVVELVAIGRLERQEHGYAPTNAYAESCCFDCFDWSGSALPTHFASAKHIANHYRVGRLDLIHAIDEAYLSGRLRLLRRQLAS